MITVIGSRGFIGRHVVAALRQRGLKHTAIGRSIPRGRELGRVIYCAGVTYDYRSRPFDTVRAHVSSLSNLLERGEVDRVVYLSSTRLYPPTARSAEETDALTLPLDTYDLSKGLGEVLLRQAKGGIVARLSHVYGLTPSSTSFIPSVITQAISSGRILVDSGPGSLRDFVSIDDVADVLIQIALSGTRDTYNVASGRLTRSGDVLTRLRELTGCVIQQHGPDLGAPRVSIDRLKTEFDYAPRDVIDDLPTLVDAYQRAAHQSRTPLFWLDAQRRRQSPRRSK